MYGDQFQVEKYSIKVPEDETAVERYLSSGAIKGIGPALASRIVKKFKRDTFRIMEEEPERLAEVKGISEAKARELAIQVEERKDLRKAMIFLQQYGISTSLAVKLYTRYGQELYTIMKQNPYRIADDISGIGFKMADEIARKVGIHTDSDFRIQSGLMYTLMQALSLGHVYLPEEELLREASALLGVEEKLMEKHIMDLLMDKKVIMKEKDHQRCIYSAQYYYMELNTAKMLHDLNIQCDMEEEEIEKRLKKVEKEFDIILDEKQHRAVVESVKNGLLIRCV